MSYWETLLVIVRRWRISVPATLLALLVGTAAFFVVPPTYQDETQVLFIGSPQQPGEKALVNPFLDLGSTLISTADVIRAIVSTQQVADRLAASGATALYAVALDQSTPAPVLIVSAEASDPQVARRTTEAVLATINQNLSEAQQNAGAPPSTWVTTTVISSLPKPKRDLTGSIRPAIIAVVAILALTMFVLFLLEGRRQKRERTGQREAGPQAQSAGSAGADPRMPPETRAPATAGPPDWIVDPPARTNPRKLTGPGVRPHDEPAHPAQITAVGYPTRPIPYPPAVAPISQPPGTGTGRPMPRLLPVPPHRPTPDGADQKPADGEDSQPRSSWGSPAEGRTSWRR